MFGFDGRPTADDAFTGLLLALGSIALLVGGIGVANTMVISVLQRRREIGLRRALGATRSHIRLQFLAEALLLSTLGGLAGAVLGAAVSAAIAAANGWAPVIPLPVLAAGVGATTLIGGVAGLYPAIRAARTPPTVALTRVPPGSTTVAAAPPAARCRSSSATSARRSNRHTVPYGTLPAWLVRIGSPPASS